MYMLFKHFKFKTWWDCFYFNVYEPNCQKGTISFLLTQSKLPYTKKLLEYLDVCMKPLYHSDIWSCSKFKCTPLKIRTNTSVDGSELGLVSLSYYHSMETSNVHLDLLVGHSFSRVHVQEIARLVNQINDERPGWVSGCSRLKVQNKHLYWSLPTVSVNA